MILGLTDANKYKFVLVAQIWMNVQGSIGVINVRQMQLINEQRRHNRRRNTRRNKSC